MDIFLIIGVIGGFFAVIVGMYVKGADVAVLLNPAAAIIIIVGTCAATVNSFPRKEILNVPNLVRVLFTERKNQNPVELVELIVSLAQQARKDGLLSLESRIQEFDNGFLKKGLSTVIDGIEPDLIREMLETEIDYMEERHRAGAQVFAAAGSYAPTLGVLGAVIGLIGALGDLNDVERLGHMIAAAFVATLYGIFIGYVLCHPFSSRLKRKSNEEGNTMRIIMEGLLSIQAGENPRSIKMKLSGMLSPEGRAQIEARSSGEQGKDE